MANDSISFLCPACGIKLTVPSSFAGVTGPCPSCNTVIQAPPAPAPLETTAATPIIHHEPVAPPPQPTPHSAPPLQQVSPYAPPVQPLASPTPPAQVSADLQVPTGYQAPQTAPNQDLTAQLPPNPSLQTPVYQPPITHDPALQQTVTSAQGQVPPPHQIPVTPSALYQPPTQPVQQTPDFALPPQLSTPPQYPATVVNVIDPTPAVVLPLQNSPSREQTPAPNADSASTATPPVLRPEPRQLPSRSNHGEAFTKPMPEPNAANQGSKPNHGRDPRQKGVFIRVAKAMIFLACAAGVVFGVIGVKNFLSADPLADSPATPVPAKKIISEEPKAETPIPPTSPPPSDPPISDPPASPSPAVPAEEALAPPLTVPPVELPTIAETPPTLPAGLEPITPGAAALEVLEKFLAAKTLAERLPLIETQTPESELASSCLAGPLPNTSRIEIDSQETNAEEGVVDSYQNVDFDALDRPINPQVILVRTRGTGEPKVVVDPFLDSFGGRLEAYAKAPTDKPGYFQVIVSALASCNDEHVPNREKKLTLKLLPQDNAKEIAKAYFGRQSKIHELLENGTYELSYGKAKACTVMLQWNLEEQPDKPYLEALSIKAFDWNP